MEYEWRPAACPNSKKMDHTSGECKKNKEALELEQERKMQQAPRMRRFIPVWMPRNTKTDDQVQRSQTDKVRELRHYHRVLKETRQHYPLK